MNTVDVRRSGIFFVIEPQLTDYKDQDMLQMAKQWCEMSSSNRTCVAAIQKIALFAGLA